MVAPLFGKPIVGLALLMACLCGGCVSRESRLSVVFPAQMIDSPAAAGSLEPNLFAAADGRVFLSWVEPVGDDHSLRYSVRKTGAWSAPVTVARGSGWFVNWADFPSVVASPDGALSAHWLQKSGEDTYAYDVKVSRSFDGGETWSTALVPHRDGTKTEHGFVSMLPWDNGRIMIVWLDGRNFADEKTDHGEGGSAKAEMTLRTAVMGPDGGLEDEMSLDDRVCDCCQTAAALTTDGAIVAYRDRSVSEVRDIWFVRHHNGQWTKPRPVAEDGWEIFGCPVNGPAIAASGRRVAVVWFTHAHENPRVKIAFSDDAGETFGQPIRVDDGDPMGRVGVVILADGSAVASWMGFTADQADIRLRRVWPDGRTEEPHTLAQLSKERASGFPVLASNDREIVVAWTDVGSPSRVRTASLRLDRAR